MVEAWLQRLVEGMQGTMKAVIKRAASNVNEMALADFLFGHPAQVALLGLQFQWTADMQARTAPRVPSSQGRLLPAASQRCPFRAHPCAGGAQPRRLTMGKHALRTRLPQQCLPAGRAQERHAHPWLAHRAAGARRWHSRRPRRTRARSRARRARRRRCCARWWPSRCARTSRASSASAWRPASRSTCTRRSPAARGPPHRAGLRVARTLSLSLP